MFSVNLVVGLIGGLAKFSFRALRLPDRGEEKQRWDQAFFNEETDAED